MRELPNIRVSLVLHTLQSKEGTPLLLLHALGGSGEDFRANLPPWPGPVYALDFSGHGRSGRLYGGGYYPELWAADADLALAAILTASALRGGAQSDAAVVFGAGLGAYVALLLAGGRPEQVHCAVLSPGAGLLGGATEPDPAQAPLDLATSPLARGTQATPCTDDCAVEAQAGWLQPPDYAMRFAASARRIVLLEDKPPSRSADALLNQTARPPWWCAVRDAASTVRCTDASAWPSLALAALRAP